MGLFDGIPVPWADRSNSSASQALIGGYNARTSRTSVELQRQSRIDQLKFREQQMQSEIEATKRMVDSMRAFPVEDEESMSRWLANGNMGYALRHDTGPLVKNLSSVFSNMNRVKLSAAKAEAESYEGKIKSGLATTFWKGLQDVPGDDQALVLAMEKDPALVPTYEQFTELGKISKRIDAKKEAAKNLAVEPKPFSVTAPSGKIIEGVYNPKSGAFKDTTSERLTEIESKLLSDALARKRSAQLALSDPVKGITGKATLTKMIEEADKIISKYSTAPKAQTETAPASTVVTTKEQFDALESGATYTGKDGRQYRKP